MAWSVLQSNSVAASSSGSTSQSVAFSSNLSSGSTIIAAVAIATALSGAPTSPSATCGGTSMVLIAQATANQGVGAIVLTALFALNTPAGQVGTTPTVQASWTGSSTTSLIIQEVSGIVTSSTAAGFIDGGAAVTKPNTAGTAPATCNAYSSTAGNEYLVAVYGDDGGPATIGTVSTGYTLDGKTVNTNSHADVGIAYKNSTNGSETASFALTGSVPAWVTIIGAFLLSGTTVNLTTPNLALAAPVPTFSAGANLPIPVTNLALGAPVLAPAAPPVPTGTWSASYARQPLVYSPGPPVMAPLAVAVNNTAGNWMFAVASWRQDAGQLGTLQFPTTVTVSDDAHNFWIPIESGQSAVSVGTGGGPPPPANISRGQISTLYAGTNGGNVSWSVNPTAGQTVLVAVWTSTTETITSLIDNGTSPSTFVVDASEVTSRGHIYIYRANGITLPNAGAYHVTITASGGSTVQAGGIAYSGVKAGPPTAHTGKSSSANDTVTTGSVTPSTSGALYFTGFGDQSNANPETITLTASGFTQQFVETNGASFIPGAVADKIDTGGPTSTQCQWELGDSVGWSSVIAVYDKAPVPVIGTSTNGIIRTAVWMAPAARTAQFVFVSPTGYQSALTTQVFTFNGVVPWYQIRVRAEVYANQSPNVALTETIGASIFTLGAIAYDVVAAAPTLTAAGWSMPTSVSVINGVDTSGDLEQVTWFDTGSGSAVSLTGASSTSMDWACVIVAVSGVQDPLPYPYGTPALENWPVLIAEIADGPNINADPIFAQGTAQWTGSGASIAAVTQPLWSPEPSAYQPLLYGSLQVTPSGAATTSGIITADYAITAGVLYTALAFVYSPPGFGFSTVNGASVTIQWKTSGHSSNGSAPGPTVTLTPGEWVQLSLSAVEAPVGTAFASLLVAETTTTGTVPASASFFVGYAAFSAATSYEGSPPDLLTWTDISSRVFTQGDIGITRGIQYEQQALEAGTLTIYVANNDGQITFGNVQSPYYPNIGDTDVPIRLRAIWPGSYTPYAVLFNGFTDAITFGISTETYYGYAEIQASDQWSRLTQQMLAVIEEEALLDNPVAFIPCNQTGANIVAGNQFSNTPAIPLLTSSATVVSTAALPAQSFTGQGIALPGAPGLSCWQVTGTNAFATGGIGYGLTWAPTSATLPVVLGITIEFWFSPVTGQTAQPTGNLTVAVANAGAGNPIWQLYINNTAGTQTALTYLNLWTWNLDGTFNGSTQIGVTPFLTASAATQSYYVIVYFNQNQVTVTVNPGGTPTQTATVSGLNLASQCTGFTWGAFTIASVNAGISSACMDIAVADIGIFQATVPPARSASHYQAGLTAFVNDIDTWRLARIASYSGFVPTLGMRALDLPVEPSPDVDIVTGATDTNTQTVSAYFTNIAQSTLALMFVNGPGTLIYRRRIEWYDRPIGQYVTGENDKQLLALNINPLNASASIAGWTGGNGATLTTGVAVAGGPLFNPFAALFSGDGSTSNPFITTTSNPAVTPGLVYGFNVWLFSSQGWNQGLNVQLQFFNASNVQVGSTTSSSLFMIAPGSIAYATSGTAQAPATAAYLKAVVLVDGIPPSSTGFYVAQAQVFQVPPDQTGGANAYMSEAPYASSVHTDSDRSQLFNFTQLTQYGQNLVSSFSGTSVLFTPTSGVIVIISNFPSIQLRGQIPYTATIYLNNTSQSSPYYLYTGSIEDFGNWVVQTLGSPLFRPHSVSLTPAATPSATMTGVFSEVGDSVTFRRRPLGSPPLEIPTYYSKMNQSINIAGGQWTTGMELSPFPQGSIIACDDVVFGVLTGQNFLGW